jgi:hypothetical protein
MENISVFVLVPKLKLTGYLIIENALHTKKEKTQHPFMNKDYVICDCNEVVFFKENEDIKLCPICKTVLVHYVDKEIDVDNSEIKEKIKENAGYPGQNNLFVEDKYKKEIWRNG